MRGAIHVCGCPEVDAALRVTTRALALKRLARCSLAAAALVTASDWARAADMPLEVPPLEPSFSWTGGYVGLHIGGAWSAGNYATPDAMCQFGGFFCPGGASGHNQPFYQGAGSTPAQYDLASSLVGGFTSGFNRQIGKAVFGLEGEAAYISMSGSGQFLTNGRRPCNPATPLNPPCSNYGAFSTFGNWYGTITARLGMTGDALFPTWSGADRALLYLKGGPALGRFGTGVSSSDFPGASFALINFSNAQTMWGVAAGAGLEWAFTRDWSLKAEYEYLSFEHATQACGPLTTNAGVVEVPGSNFCTSTAMHGINTAKVGINYRFSDRLWPF
jgi:outer membrane immunogenic protein